MATNGNKDLIREHVKNINEANRDATKIRAWGEKIYAPSYICHYPFRDMSREEAIGLWVTMVSGFPGFEWSTDSLVSEENTVINVSTIKGVHNGILPGMPATGKPILVKWVTMYRIGGEKILEGWEFPDLLSMMTQLGVIPSSVLESFGRSGQEGSFSRTL